MGGFIKVKCECGFETDFMAGSGRENVDTVCNAPALCQNCNIFSVLNYLDKNAACPQCNGNVTFYNDPGLQEQDENKNRSPVKSDFFILPSVKCLCPKCGKKQMTFTHVGCWA